MKPTKYTNSTHLQVSVSPGLLTLLRVFWPHNSRCHTNIQGPQKINHSLQETGLYHHPNNIFIISFSKTTVFISNMTEGSTLSEYFSTAPRHTSTKKETSTHLHYKPITCQEQKVNLALLLAAVYAWQKWKWWEMMYTSGFFSNFWQEWPLSREMLMANLRDALPLQKVYI